MKEAIFVYKCRLCGIKFDAQITSEENALYVLTSIVHGIPTPKHLIGLPPDFIAVHAGCKEGVGVADLIGYIVRGEDD